jgi:hypothetical protein
MLTIMNHYGPTGISQPLALHKCDVTSSCDGKSSTVAKSPSQVLMEKCVVTSWSSQCAARDIMA